MMIKKILIVIAILGSWFLAGLIAIGGILFFLVSCGTKDYDRQMALSINIPYAEEAQDIMHSYGLNTQKSYDQSVYDAIPEINEKNIRGFYQLLGRRESEKALKTLGYKDWDDYLIQHGYVKYGYEPSFDRWEKAWCDEWENHRYASDTTAAISNSND